MTTGVILFLSIRAIHVLLAAIWVGATVFLTFFLMPTIASAGPVGGSIMVGLERRGLNKFFPSLGGMTVLSGIYLYWRFTGGFDPTVSGSHAGIAFGIGGAAGILAAIVGGSVVGRGAMQLQELAPRAATLPAGPERAALVAKLQSIQARVQTGSWIVLGCMAIALILMAIGHYV